MQKGCPYADVYGSGIYIRHSYVKHNRVSYKVPCKTNAVTIESEDHCTDATTLLDLTPSFFDDVPALWVVHEVQPEFASTEDANLILEAQTGTYQCLRNNAKLTEPKANVEYGVGSVPAMLLVAKDGGKPPVVSRGRAAAAGFFFSGIAYSYGIARIPVFRQKVYKSNVSLIAKSLDGMCDTMGACVDVE